MHWLPAAYGLLGHRPDDMEAPTLLVQLRGVIARAAMQPRSQSRVHSLYSSNTAVKAVSRVHRTRMDFHHAPCRCDRIDGRFHAGKPRMHRSAPNTDTVPTLNARPFRHDVDLQVLA
jgi:hypothetical protein